MALSAETVTIKVSTTALRSKAETISTMVKKLRTDVDQLDSRVNSTKAYWIGDAGDLHRKLFNDMRDEINEMIRRLGEHPRDLIAIADVYEGIERDVTSLSQALDGDVIE